MTKREIELRKLMQEQKDNNRMERVMWALQVLGEYKRPGGVGRYHTPEEAKEARRLYLRAYSLLYTNDGYKQPHRSESKIKANSRKLRKRRNPELTKFYVRMYEAPVAKCFYCKRDLRPHEREADHYFPISRGGEHEPDNLVICCYFCNRAKGDMLPDDFIRSGIPASYIPPTY